MENCIHCDREVIEDYCDCETLGADCHTCKTELSINEIIHGDGNCEKCNLMREKLADNYRAFGDC